MSRRTTESILKLCGKNKGMKCIKFEVARSDCEQSGNGHRDPMIDVKAAVVDMLRLFYGAHSRRVALDGLYQEH